MRNSIKRSFVLRVKHMRCRIQKIFGGKPKHDKDSQSNFLAYQHLKRKMALFRLTIQKKSLKRSHKPEIFPLETLTFQVTLPVLSCLCIRRQAPQLLLAL